MILRDFRDYVLQRNDLQPSPMPQENIILVGVRTAGAAGGAIVNNLCQQTKSALAKVEQLLESSNDHELSNKGNKFRVECIVPSDLSFKEEIRAAQRAKIIITVHGTISYLSLFSRDGTQQISIASPKEYKEHQILLYASHTQLHYLTWNRLDDLHRVLALAIANSHAYFQ